MLNILTKSFKIKDEGSIINAMIFQLDFFLRNNLKFSVPNFDEIKLRTVNIIYSPIPLCLLAIRN